MELYIYRLSSDTGLAPCVTQIDNLLTLACCKGGKIYNGKVCETGIRYHIGEEKKYKKEDVYIIGIYQGKLLYWAKIIEAPTMIEYYNNKKYIDRFDNIYYVENNNLKRNNKYINIHSDTEQQKRDIAGKYVLISNDFVYLGNKCIKLDILDKYGPKKQETKKYKGEIAERIIEECKKKAVVSNWTPNNKFEV